MDEWYTPSSGAAPEWAWCPDSDSEQSCFLESHNHHVYENDFSEFDCYKNPNSWSNNEKSDFFFSYNQNCVHESDFSDFNFYESAPNFYLPYENHSTLDESLPSSEELINCEKFSPPYLESCTTLDKEHLEVMSKQIMEESLEIIKAFKSYKQNELQTHEVSLEIEEDASTKGHGENLMQFYETNPLQVEEESIEQDEEEFIPQAPIHHFIDEEYVVEVIKANGEIIVLGDIFEELEAQRAKALLARFKEAIVQFDEEQSMLGENSNELTVPSKPEHAEAVESKASCDLHMMLATILGARFEKPSSKFFCWNLKEKIFPQTVEEKFFKIFPYYPP